MGKIEDLKRINELKQKGIITDIEFETEKYKILNNNGDSSNKEENSIYTASLAMGILTLLLCVVPVVGLIIGIIAVAVSITAENKREANKERKGKEKIGVILSIVGGIIAAIWSGINVGFILAM